METNLSKLILSERSAGKIDLTKLFKKPILYVYFQITNSFLSEVGIANHIYLYIYHVSDKYTTHV